MITLVQSEQEHVYKTKALSVFHDNVCQGLYVIGYLCCGWGRGGAVTKLHTILTFYTQIPHVNIVYANISRLSFRTLNGVHSFLESHFTLLDLDMGSILYFRTYTAVNNICDDC